jgi:hypothetical protein
MLKKFLLVALLAVLPGIAFGQSAQKQPFFIASNTWVDFGNGPLEILPVEGSGLLFSRGSTGVGSTSGSSTTLTLTATPTYAPCVGCVISGSGITAGTTVSAFNGTTGITLSAAMTVASSTTLYWGVACPTSGAPPVNASISGAMAMRTATQPGRYPVYSSARLCGFGGSGGGISVLTFPIGSW